MRRGTPLSPKGEIKFEHPCSFLKITIIEFEKKIGYNKPKE